MKAAIFYSWQSDLPNNINRNLIQDSLEKAVRNLARDGELEVEAVVDRDTLGKAGSPSIAETIFKKIESAAVFVADVSIVAECSPEEQEGPAGDGTPSKPAKPKFLPNPNVCIELGYAIAKLGEERIILVLNEAHGGPERLPFDLKFRRALCYTAHPGDPKAEVRADLIRKLQGALKLILEQLKTEEDEEARARSAAPKLLLTTRDATMDLRREQCSGDNASAILRWDVYLNNIGRSTTDVIALTVKFHQGDAPRNLWIRTAWPLAFRAK